MNLTEKKNTVSSIYQKWIEEKNGRGSSKYETLARVSIADANKAVIDSLRECVGHGISERQLAKQAEKLSKCRKPVEALFIMSQAMLAGDGLTVCA